MFRRSRHAVRLAALASTAALTCAAFGPSAIAAGDPAAPTPSGAKPTIVLIHGAFADASSWGGEVALLEHQGYDARAIANPLENLDNTDADSVREFLATLSGPIVLVGHSYGRSVITNAAAGNANVKALVYVDAAAPDVGETTASLSAAGSVLTRPQGELFDPVPCPGAPELYLQKDNFLQHFGNDLPPELASRAWSSQRAASAAALFAPSRSAAWKQIPSWYFVSSGDQVITPDSETAMADQAHAQITRFNGGSHLTLVSHPEAVTQVIQSAIASVH